MGSEKPKIEGMADAGEGPDVDGLLKAAWRRREAESTPSTLIDHVDRLTAENSPEDEN